MGLKKPGKREIAYLWAVYDLEKSENGPLQAVMHTKKLRG